MKHFMKTVGLMLFLAFLFIGSSAKGQKVSGSISGLVTDPSGMAVPGAEVTVLDDGTGVSTNVTTTSSGLYVATSLIPGTYTVAVTAKGFEEFKSTNNVLNVDSVLRVDCPLRVGKVTEVVTVAATAAVLKTDTADVSDVIANQTLNELPILNRDVTQMIVINPGALRGSAAFIGEDPGADTNGFVNGFGSGNNSHQMNGIDDEETIQGAGMINPPIDSLQEIKVTMNSYDAQYGQVGGAVFEASTKSGTNRYHGSLFEYDQNNKMFARNPYTQSTTNVAPWRWNQLGGSMGGPVKKDKIFFFSDYQGMRSRQGSTDLYSMPTAQMLQGNFSAVASLYPIYDPTTGDVNGNGRTQFAYGGTPNVIPPNRIDSVVAHMTALMPLPNTPTGSNPAYVNNFTKSGSFTSDTDEVDPRIDYNVNQSTRMFGVYTFMRSIYDAPPIFGNVLGGAGFGPQAENGGTRTQAISFTLVHNFGATTIGDFRFGLSRFHSNLAQTDLGLTTAQQFGLPGINMSDPRTTGLPEFSWSGPIVNSAFLGNPYSDFYELEQTAEYSTNWTKIHGRQTFQWGAELRPDASLARIDKSLRGAFTFNQQLTGANIPGSTGIGFASFLLGDANSFTRGDYLSLPQEYQNRHALYGQDRWRVNKKLVLSLGLRWEYFSPTFSKGTAGEVNFNPSTANMEFAGLGGINKYAGVQPDYKDFDPRIGIAYTIDSKTVLRIGYARSFFINSGGANFATYCCQWPIGSNQAISSPTSYTSIFSLEAGPPSASTTNVVVPSNGLLPLPNGQTVYSRPFNDPTSSLDSGNVTLEHQFSPSMTGSIAYVGGRGRHLWDTPNINDPLPGAGAFCPRQLYCSEYGISSSLQSRQDSGNSDSNDLQVQFDKKYAHGNQFRVAYTWQRTINDNNYDDPFDREAYKGLSGTAPQWLTLSHVAELPLGPGHFIGGQTKGPVAAAIRGWRLDGIWQFQAGSRLSPSMNENTLNVEYYSQIPNCSGNPNNTSHTINSWFNDSVFSVPAAYQFGNCGLNDINGPRWWNADLQLEKDIRITERVHLTFRWMWYNAFNHDNPGNPNTVIDNPASVVGHITSVNHTMRETQLGAHLYF